MIRIESSRVEWNSIFRIAQLYNGILALSLAYTSAYVTIYGNIYILYTERHAKCINKIEVKMLPCALNWCVYYLGSLTFLHKKLAMILSNIVPHLVRVSFLHIDQNCLED